MKSISFLRVLCLLGFLLLVAPFYDQCNGRGMKQVEAPAEEAPVTEEVEAVQEIDSSSNNLQQVENDTISQPIEEKTSVFQNAYEFVDDDESFSAVEMAYGFLNIFETPIRKTINEIINDLKKRKYSEPTYLICSFSFFCISIDSFLLMCFLFFRKMRWIYIFAFINLFFILISLMSIIFFDELFETYKQIKWGYYTFIFVQIGILFLSRKVAKTQRKIL